MPSAPQAIVDAPSVHFRPSDLDEVAATYPDVPRLIVIKIDVQRRGVFYTDRALAAFDPAKHQARSHALFGSRDGQVTPKPEALLLRDGTSILADSTPLYPFGFGLAYTTFDYKNLQVSPATIAPGGSAKVSVDVTNTGTVKADEIVQLYIHAVVSVPVRPVEELKDFARIALNPGETRTVTFNLTPDKLESFDLQMKRTVQPGAFEVMVGKSSVDVLKVPLHVE